ncbi:hypothetical protein PEP31012_03590 [Pandoraea eparura]|uniref:Uncharacterized protein n=1 Tax=Pandoraea eparura TaxID=2508291 RepID=A0A5E4WZJ8_9BURK|nr:hypothetical protein [Pandoraea eparura]VVE29435.1 hypothetical protein PEP31012_03590 [Pandoraea eparura]
MKREILESMDKGFWYSYQTLASVTGFDTASINRACRALAAEKVVEIEIIGKKSRVRLLMNRPALKVSSYPSVPSVATVPYQPRWTPMQTYDRDVLAHQALCEELR